MLKFNRLLTLKLLLSRYNIFNNYSTSAEWNNCFIKNNQEILLYLADFALQEQAKDNLMLTFSWIWYNGSYTIAAKPIKSLELHYTTIQFLIIVLSLLFQFYHITNSVGQLAISRGWPLNRGLTVVFCNKMECYHCWSVSHANFGQVWFGFSGFCLS